jgi:peptidyl-prolyl cis-trans isomerase SurA
MIRLHTVLVVIIVLAASPALAAKKDTAVPMKPDIAAVVGQEVVSTYDLDNRIKFIMASSNLPMTEEVRARLRPQVIRTLIDERLQLKNAAQNAIQISDLDVQEAIKGIEKDRGMQQGTIFRMLENDRVPKDTFREQIRAQLAWRKLVLKKLRPLVRINDDELKLVKLPPVAVAPQEIKMAVLTLPVDSPEREKEVLATALNLAKELRAGASFEEVTRQLSGGAVKGSDEAFWVHPAQLAPPLARALANASDGMITEPIRTETGFALVKVYATRSRASDAEKAKSPEAETERARNYLFQQKIELEAQKYLRNLRQNSFIEIR